MASHDRVRVVIRFRPLKEAEQLGHVTIDRHAHSVQVRDPGNSSANGSWQFDSILDSATTNEEVYASVAKDVVTSSLGGINGTIFAYGQTSSGKTFSMRSIMQQAFDVIFNTIAEDRSRTYTVSASYLEIYNETLIDLLNPSNKSANLTNSPANTVAELFQLLALGQESRKVAATNMNEHSSRSHAVFRLSVTSKVTDEALQCYGQRFSAHLNFVDLAGSERQAKTGAQGARLREANSINTSLMELGKVVRSVARGEACSYRNSVLTKILQGSLGGNCRTVFLCCATAAAPQLAETCNTLRFAANAKQIQNKVSQNVTDEASEVQRLRARVAQLEEELATAKRRRLSSQHPAAAAASATAAAGGTAGNDDEEELDVSLDSAVANRLRVGGSGANDDDDDGYEQAVAQATDAAISARMMQALQQSAAHNASGISADDSFALSGDPAIQQHLKLSRELKSGRGAKRSADSAALFSVDGADNLNDISAINDDNDEEDEFFDAESALSSTASHNNNDNARANGPNDRRRRISLAAAAAGFSNASGLAFGVVGSAKLVAAESQEARELRVAREAEAEARLGALQQEFELASRQLARQRIVMAKLNKKLSRPRKMSDDGADAADPNDNNDEEEDVDDDVCTVDVSIQANAERAIALLESRLESTVAVYSSVQANLSVSYRTAAAARDAAVAEARALAAQLSGAAREAADAREAYSEQLARLTDSVDQIEVLQEKVAELTAQLGEAVLERDDAWLERDRLLATGAGATADEENAGGDGATATVSSEELRAAESARRAAESELESMRLKMQMLADAKASAEEAARAARDTATMRNAAASAERARLEESEMKLIDIEFTLAQAQQRAGDAEAECARLAKQAEDASASAREGRLAAAEASGRATGLQERLSEAEAAVASLHRDLAANAETVAALRARAERAAQDTQDERARAERRVAGLVRELEEARAAQDSANATALEQKLRAQKSAFEAMQQEEEVARAVLSQRVNELTAELEEAAQAVERHRGAWAQEREALLKSIREAANREAALAASEAEAQSAAAAAEEEADAARAALAALQEVKQRNETQALAMVKKLSADKDATVTMYQARVASLEDELRSDSIRRQLREMQTALDSARDGKLEAEKARDVAVARAETLRVQQAKVIREALKDAEDNAQANLEAARREARNEALYAARQEERAKREAANSSRSETERVLEQRLRDAEADAAAANAMADKMRKELAFAQSSIVAEKERMKSMMAMSRQDREGDVAKLRADNTGLAEQVRELSRSNRDGLSRYNEASQQLEEERNTARTLQSAVTTLKHRNELLENDSRANREMIAELSSRIRALDQNYRHSREDAAAAQDKIVDLEEKVAKARTDNKKLCAKLLELQTTGSSSSSSSQSQLPPMPVAHSRHVMSSSSNSAGYSVGGNVPASPLAARPLRDSVTNVASSSAYPRGGLYSVAESASPRLSTMGAVPAPPMPIMKKPKVVAYRRDTSDDTMDFSNFK